MRARGGKLDGFDLLDLAVMRSLLAAQQARPQDYDPRALRAWEESVAKAMDSVTAGAGDELVPQEEARQLWADVNAETAVASLFETVTMPTNPFDVMVVSMRVAFAERTGSRSAAKHTALHYNVKSPA